MINIDGKQIKLQIWDTVRPPARAPRACTAPAARAGRGVRPEQRLLDLSRRARRPARSLSAPSRARTTAARPARCWCTTSLGAPAPLAPPRGLFRGARRRSETQTAPSCLRRCASCPLASVGRPEAGGAAPLHRLSASASASMCWRAGARPSTTWRAGWRTRGSTPTPT